ncbi:MAG: hypothetical protein BHW60_06000 [Sutterella sp. 54_7]|nr:MAG: hypothetical protein BHW60_06000 [Sutterella sp. 54_7]
MSLKIFDYRCENHHVFEAWLRSEVDAGPSACPVCGSLVLSRLPSAPAVRAAEASASSQSAAPAASLSDLLTALRHAAMKARDVGEDFPETVRAMASGAAACESVRGKCTLRAEGIGVLALPKDWFEPMN